uniref:Large ribosomal subunit protein uL11 C-terminal domain-containing protein n=1 Tax=Sphenodon punctatus TaxID=8508 RepID=A0A8D0GRV9_SPHPU
MIQHGCAQGLRPELTEPPPLSELPPPALSPASLRCPPPSGEDPRGQGFLSAPIPSPLRPLPRELRPLGPPPPPQAGLSVPLSSHPAGPAPLTLLAASGRSPLSRGIPPPPPRSGLTRHVQDRPRCQVGEEGVSRECHPDHHPGGAGRPGAPLGARPRAGHEVAGMVTLKQLYEIAQVKVQDPGFVVRDTSLEQLVRSLIGTARSLGIEVVRELNAEEYAVFLKEREEELAAAAEAREAEAAAQAKKK